MKKIGYLLFMFVLLLLSYDNVKAEACDEDDIKRLKEIANNVIVDYSYNEDYENYDNYGFHDVAISGITNEIYGRMFLDVSNEVILNYDDDNLGTFEEAVEEGPKTLYIYSKMCDDTLLKKLNVKIPYYNIYSTYEECKGISGDELEVCSKFLDKKISYSTFQNAIRKYNSNNVVNSPLSFFEKHKYIVIGIIVVIAVAVLAFVVKRRKDKNVLD